MLALKPLGDLLAGLGIGGIDTAKHRLHLFGFALLALFTKLLAFLETLAAFFQFLFGAVTFALRKREPG